LVQQLQVSSSKSMLLQLVVALSAVVGVLGQASEVFVYGDSPESQQVGWLYIYLSWDA
jgi:hypothetical protein